MTDDVQLNQTIQSVDAFAFDTDGISLRFVDRLARENDWTLSYSERVLREYKRFCVLAMHAGHSVTPSEQVDQAWHLHLTYTRSYWDRFCKQTLGRPLHHDPTAGGLAEGEKFHDWYSTTLESYRRIFGTEPPRDIWPAPVNRFRHAGQWKWVNGGHVWIVPKRPVLTAVAVFGLLLLLFAPTGCRSLLLKLDRGVGPWIVGTIPPFHLGIDQFLQFYLALTMMSLFVIWTLRQRASRPPRADSRVNSSQLSLQEIAVLTGGGRRLAQLAITRLFAGGHIEVQPAATNGETEPEFIALADGPQDEGLDRELFAAIAQRKSGPNLMLVVRPYYDQAVRRLVEYELRRPGKWYTSTGNWIAVAVVLIGGIRVGQCLASEVSIGYVAGMTMIFGVLAVLLNRRFQRNTAAGIQVAQSLVAALQADRKPLSRAQPEHLVRSVAIFGVAVLASLADLDPLRDAIVAIKMASNNLGDPRSGTAVGCGYGIAPSGCGSGGDAGDDGGACGGGGCGGGGCGGGCSGGGS